MTFVVVEGLDASGKSTAIQHLQKNLTNEGFKVLVTSQPWDGFDLNPDDFNNKYDYFKANRNAHINYIEQMQDEYDFIICDRYINSSYVYQYEKKHEIIKDNEILIQPDILIFLDASYSVRENNLAFRKNNDANDYLSLENHKDYRNRYYDSFKDLNKKSIIFPIRIHSIAKLKLNVDLLTKNLINLRLVK